MRKDFNDCLELIKSEKIRRFVKRALDAAPKQFWTAPCSSSGKYHPPENQVEGGIIVHSRKAIQVAIELFRFFEIQDQLVKDKIIAACILHDIQKCGIPWGEKTDYEHGPIAARWMVPLAALESEPQKEDIIHVDVDLMDILELVRDHMGIWNKPKPTPALKKVHFISPNKTKEDGYLVNEKAIWHLIVQLADYWASRKWCSFVIDEYTV